MKFTKKTLLFLLTACLSLGVLAGCDLGGTKGDDGQGSTPSGQTPDDKDPDDKDPDEQGSTDFSGYIGNWHSLDGESYLVEVEDDAVYFNNEEVSALVYEKGLTFENGEVEYVLKHHSVVEKACVSVTRYKNANTDASPRAHRQPAAAFRILGTRYWSR